MGTYFEKIFSPYLSGFRKRYGCQHLLMRMTEKWRTMLDNKKLIAALSMDLSKAFNPILDGVFGHNILDGGGAKKPPPP